MPWVRIDEHAMEHPKVAGLSDGAFRLWVVGLVYCQKFLTDGLITEVAQRGLRGYTAKRKAELMSSGLWDAAESGVHIHDFLDWNASRAHVLSAREQARERLKKHKEKRVSNDVANAHLPVTFVDEVVGSGSSEEGSGETNDVQRFIDRWQALHRQYRGVAYLGNPTKDYTAACELVAAFGYEFAEAIAVYGLNDPDPFMRKSTVTLPMLKSRASKYAEELKTRRLA